MPKTLLKFAVVGVLATLTNLCVFFLLQEAQFSLIASNVGAWMVAIIVSYVGHKNWTFTAAKTQSSTQTKVKFLVNSLITLAFNYTFTYVFTDVFPSTFFIVVSIVFLTPIMSFILMKYWVFISDRDS